MQARVRIALTVWVALLLIIGGYGVVITSVEGFNLRAVRTMHQELYKPTARLVAALQQERQLSVQLVGSGGSGSSALRFQREETNKAAATFRRLAGTAAEQGSEKLVARVDQTLSRLSKLNDSRAAIDGNSVTRSEAAAAYTKIIDTAFPLYHAMPANSQSQVSKAHQTLIRVQNAREILAQEISLLIGAIAEGRLANTEYQEFTRLAAVQHFLFADIEPKLNDSQQSAYRGLVQSKSFTSLQDIEGRVIDHGVDQMRVPVSNDEWSAVGTGALTELADLESDLANQMLKHSDAEAVATLTRATLVLLGGLVLGTALMMVWFRVAPRHVLVQLLGLKDAALAFANKRLPSVVAKLQRGECVNIQAEVPHLEFGPDEFGDVGRAFNAVQQVAVQASIDQAKMRNGIRDVFVNLARRSQGLVHRQLGLLDEMERRTNDPDELERLFAIDHLATRMRRHAEDLIILSGASPGRQWRRPVAMVDVVRSAIGEIEAYNRVNVLQVDAAHLSGHVVADVIPLLSALIDNAATYSPPETKVRVMGDLVPNGFVFEIEDSGLGMDEEDLTRFNQRLAHPPEFNPSDTVQLGFFVVAYLAHRHDISVTLRKSPYGGTTAIVLIPGILLKSQGTASHAGSADDTAASASEPHTSESEDSTPRQSCAARRTAEDSTPRQSCAARRAAATSDSNGHSADNGSSATKTAPSESEGLPRRVRQASLTDELRATTPTQHEPEQHSDAAVRSPEEIRAMMTTFQRGSQQGRSVAEALEGQSHELDH